jgi:hypothetical protein
MDESSTTHRERDDTENPAAPAVKREAEKGWGH